MSEQLITSLLKQQIIEETDIVKLRYGMAVIQSESVKTILLLVIFQMLGYISPFIFLFLLTIPLRMSTGGIHVNSSVGCFLLSFAFYFTELFILPRTLLSEAWYSVILFASIAMILLLPPAPPAKRPIKTRKRHITNKRISCFLCIFWAWMLRCCITAPYFIHCGIWAIFIQAIQVIIIYGINKWKRRISHV